MEDALKVVRDYRLDRLPTPSLLGAWSFFQEAEAPDKAFEAARQLYARRADLKPDQLYGVAMDLGRRYQDADQPQQAEECLQAALAAAPENDAAKRFEARFALCDLHFLGMNDPARARPEYEKLREDFPKADPGRRREALIRIGDTYRAEGKTDEALKSYKQAETDPAFLPEQPRRLVVAAQLEAAESYLRTGHAEEAASGSTSCSGATRRCAWRAARPPCACRPPCSRATTRTPVARPTPSSPSPGTPTTCRRSTSPPPRPAPNWACPTRPPTTTAR